MKQIIAIHGGDAYPTYEAYWKDLEEWQIDPTQLVRGRGWRALLGDVLGPEYQVIEPRMPNSANAVYAEWKLWFEKYLPHLNDGVIMIGHSLGAIFLAKYLSENKVPVKIAATFLVAGPYAKDGERDLVQFNLTGPLTLLEEQGGKIFLYHSKDDPVVHFSELAQFQAALPKAIVRALDGRGHFDQDTFPEIVEDIKSL
jgi:uncharacterized protein